MTLENHGLTRRNTMNDSTKMPKPDLAPEGHDRTGRVTRDDKGNAVWQWSRNIETPTVQVKRLGLSVAEDNATLPGRVNIKRVAASSGIDPYDSGLVEKDTHVKKRNLQDLSRWVEMRKKLGEDTQD
jgi:hypothetical protein